jgi:Ca2+-binding RTX toxin-like protein
MSPDGTSFQFAGAPGEHNVVRVVREDFAIKVVDAGAPLTPGQGCQPSGLHEVRCSPVASQCGLADCYAAVDLGDHDDYASVGHLPGLAMSIRAGPGDDVVTGDPAPAFPGSTSGFGIDGGAGDDALLGTGGNDILVGGTGADLLDGRGGLGDTAGYQARSGGVVVTLDRMANDGAPGEGDNVQTENIDGGSGPDRLIGNDAANALTGGRGRDVIDGGRGADVFVSTVRDEDSRIAPDPGDVVGCGDGDDRGNAERTDEVRTDCEVVAYGEIPAYRAVVVAPLRVRASRDGRIRLRLRRAPPPRTVSALEGDLAGTVALTTQSGKARSTTARFRLAEEQETAVVLRLTARARRLLARYRSITLSAVRHVRPMTTQSSVVGTGSLRLSVAVTILRPRPARRSR